MSDRKRGRPPKISPDEATLAIIVGLAQIMCSQAEAASVLGVAPRTFEDFLRRHKKARETWENGRELAKVSLRRAQFRLAENNVTMAIWLGKQLLGQRDQIAHDVSIDVNVAEVRASLEAKLARLRAANRLLETKANGSVGEPEQR